MITKEKKLVIENEKVQKNNQRNAVAAGFLGWTLDAFDFFILTFTLAAVAKDFDKTIPEIALTLTASLVMRPVGAFIFGLLADRFGRKGPLMISITFYSIIEIFSGLAPTYTIFLLLRLLYGIGMGGEWGVGASLVMESVSVKRRGFYLGFCRKDTHLDFFLQPQLIILFSHISAGERCFLSAGCPPF
jgi:SHS family lactate transporter-like MFS transporter